MHFGDEYRAQMDKAARLESAVANGCLVVAVCSGIAYAFFFTTPFMLALLILSTGATVWGQVSLSIMTSTRLIGDIYRAAHATETMVKLARREIKGERPSDNEVL